MTHHPSRSVRSRRSYLSLLCVGTKSLLILTIFVLCSTGIQNQGLIQALQILYK
ncbi:unnamed protein product [Rhodiola kirilowii]